MERTSEQAYRETLQEYRDQLVPEWHPIHQQVERVLNRLIPHTGLTSQVQWKVHVINNKEKQAFVLPGGKVFVHTGILPVTKDDDGLATVLGHEIAHNIAKHPAERLSGSGIVMLIGYVATFLLGVGDFGLTRMAIDLGFNMPNGRKQETEADFIGLRKQRSLTTRSSC